MAQGELSRAQEQLDAKQRELDEVQALYDAAMREKQTLMDDATVCRRKMANATALIDGLGGEKVRSFSQLLKLSCHIVVDISIRLSCCVCLSDPLDREQCPVPDSDQTPGWRRVAGYWLPVLRWSL